MNYRITQPYGTKLDSFFSFQILFMRYSLLFLAIPFLITSCYTQRNLDRKSDFKVDLFAKQNIDGLYENAVPEDNRNSLWQDLNKNKSFKDLVFSADFTQVELELVSDKLLKAKLYRRGVVEDSLELKGKIKNGYFVANRKFTLIPLPFFFYYAENKTILGNDDQGNLILVQGQMNDYVALLSVYGGESDEIVAMYQKL